MPNQLDNPQPVVNEGSESLRRSLRKKRKEPELKGFCKSNTEFTKSATRRVLYEDNDELHQVMKRNIDNESVPSDCNDSPSLIIDERRLMNLFHFILEKTRSCSIDDLLKLYAEYSHILYRHRMSWDRSNLLKVLLCYLNPILLFFVGF